MKVKPLFLKLLWKSGPIPCKGKKDLTRYKFLLSDEVGHIQAICFNEHGQNLNQRLEVFNLTYLSLKNMMISMIFKL